VTKFDRTVEIETSGNSGSLGPGAGRNQKETIGLCLFAEEEEIWNLASSRD
jgi:hypothetical protein